MKLWMRVTLAWIGLFILAFVNGAFREIIMKKLMGIQDQAAHQLSCLTGVILWTGFTLWIWRYLKIKTFKESILTGIGWLITTMLVETFILNRNLSWTEILNTYNVLAGEFWGLVLLWIGLMPIVIYKLRGAA